MPLRRSDSERSDLVAELARAARPLEDDASLDPILERAGDARFVLLGEASHGTSEFYTWRDRLSRRLIREKGFSFIAVEGDWPDCQRVDRWVKGEGEERAVDVLHAFARWPTWMWANHEVAALCEWMREWNDELPHARRVGFHGLDVYSLWDSMREVTDYLGGLDPELARQARSAYRCFDPYFDDAQEYARATALVPTSCEDEAVAVLARMQARAAALRASGRDDFFDAEQNAIVARNAERYYRTMVRGGPSSWNVRDHHMCETLERLVRHYGRDAKAIVWEHNTHVGDARFTDMAAAGMVNVGQLARQQYGDGDVVIVGFGSYEGTVIAGDEWAAPMRRMRVPEARPGSVEALLHEAGGGADRLLVFDGSADGGIVGLDAPLAHRAIGVVYDPTFERYGNYVPTRLARRYDAFIHVDRTHALDALHLEEKHDGEVLETFPSGM
jgi:erythromycin esterase-like protein